MSWSYTGDMSIDLNYVRTLIGDTDTNDQQFSDQIITGMLSRVGDALSTAITLAVGLVAFYSRRVDTSIDSVRVAMGQRADHYKLVVSQLKAMAAASTSVACAPIVTGVSISAMQGVDQDTDRVPSRMLVGMMEAPGVLPPNSPDAIFAQFLGLFP